MNSVLSNNYITVGKNNITIPESLKSSILPLQYKHTIKLKLPNCFNSLYTFWKPSHFYTGLEFHTGDFSCRTFRYNLHIFVAVKMYVKSTQLFVDVFSNKKLSAKEINNIKNRIIYSYGLNEEYSIPPKIIRQNVFLKKVYPSFNGMRISCPESFFEISIISLLLQNTTISRTTSMFRNLIERYGQLIEFDNYILYCFYSPENLLDSSESDLKEFCRLGYRAKYIVNYARFFSENSELKLRELTKEQLISSLETIKGVGKYTSNIVASSALRDTMAIPFDSWNRKILSRSLYSDDSISPQELKMRMESDFGDYAGLVALYVIENEYSNQPVVPLIHV